MPSQLSVRAQRADLLRDGFNRWMTTIVPITSDSIYAAMQEAVKKSPGWLGGNAYTTPEAGYVRTGRLGRSVSIDRTGATATIRNEAYSPRGFFYGALVLGYASGAGQKAVYVRNGWVTMRAAVDEQIAKLTDAGGGEAKAALVSSARESGL